MLEDDQAKPPMSILDVLSKRKVELTEGYEGSLQIRGLKHRFKSTDIQ